LLPTVWIAVAVSRWSAAINSFIRRTPMTALSSLPGSATAPPRTTLSTMMTLPGRVIFIAHST
jgi:hypothetical protein